MAFRFALAAVLKYRENLERREYLALGRVHQEIAQVEAQLRLLEQWCSGAAHAREAETAQGIAAVHLQAAFEQELKLERQRDELQARRQELKVRRQQCLKAYEQACQNREVLEDLRLRQLNAYRLDQAKREQRGIDDLFLSRRRRSH
jgi:flagellar export protein FliJ